MVQKEKKKQTPERREFGDLLQDNGVMFLSGDISLETTTPICASIIEYNLRPSELQPPHLTLLINSQGGYVAAALQLIDLMEQSAIPVHTYGMGEVISAALFIFMSGEKGHRYTTENTIFMSHQYSAGSEGKEHELFSTIKEFEIISTKTMAHYKKCTRKSESYIRKHLLPASDCWMTPEDAIKHGIADRII